MRRGIRGALTRLVLAGALLAGCTGADEGTDPAASGGEEESVSQDLEERPDTRGLIPADTEPPGELQVEDVLVGDGALVEDGDLVAVDYVGVRWSDGAEFDASWERGQPIEFELGAGRVIAGWEQGLQGMQVGGRRIITIPPELAYGDRGAGPMIGSGETLVFVVDLVRIG